MSAELKELLTRHGQTHLLQFWAELTPAERERLVGEIQSINLPEVCGYFRKAKESWTDVVEKLDDHMKPMAEELCGSVLDTDADQVEKYRQDGLRCIAEGQVGVLLMAGGQGTRLGVTYPKGMYSVGLLSGKTLFQLQAERIQRLQSIARESTGKSGLITWYIMTSGHTMAPTKKYLADNNYFGLDRSNIVFFEQGKLPCFDFDGNILLAAKGEVAQAPDGNGGLYRALRDQKVIADMQRRGVLYLHAHSVDNILIQVADPVFIGYCISKGAQCGAKVVKKTNPTEAVGVVCKVDGLFQVVEYSEITQKTAELTDPQGNLVFSAGNICNHFFTTAFLADIAENHETALKLHVAKKKIPYINPEGTKISPTTPNGIKIEKFVFDVFQFAGTFVTWEVPRPVEFSALKNGDEAGKDCPRTARADLYSLHKIYATKAGGVVQGDEIEISPLLSYAGENLETQCKGQTLKSPVLLKAKQE